MITYLRLRGTTACCSLYDLRDCCGLRDYSKAVKVFPPMTKGNNCVLSPL